MTDNKILYDRRQVDDDDKQRALVLPTMNLVPPSVGICAPPLRFYPLNNEWAKIVMGLVSWLATIAPWRDAQDETYIGIQEIETYMIGCEPCAALLTCLQGIVDTPYEELSDVLRAIVNALKDIQHTEGTPTSPSVLLENPALLTDIAECDYDNLFAATTGLVKFANDAITDLLQQVDAATGGLEMAGDIVSAIPGLGLLPFDEIIAMAQAFFDNLLTNYQAAYTTELADQYRCDLFCLAKEECELFFVQAFGYFVERANMSVAITDMRDVVEFLTQGTFSGEEYVHALHAFFFFVLAFRMDFFGKDADYLARVVAASYNDSDPDWAILCECVDDYDKLYSFAYNDAAGWTVVWGQWIDPGNVNLYNEHVPGLHETLKVERLFVPSFDGLKQINTRNPSISYSHTHVGAGTYISITHAGGIYTDVWLGVPPIPTEFVLSETLDGVSYISIEVREDQVGDGGATRLGGIQLIGTSANQPPDPPG
jgi:hypothetical protein